MQKLGNQKTSSKIELTKDRFDFDFTGDPELIINDGHNRLRDLVLNNIKKVKVKIV